MTCGLGRRRLPQSEVGDRRAGQVKTYSYANDDLLTGTS
jgi:hypothetical protein